jgi:hypothetical protein
MWGDRVENAPAASSEPRTSKGFEAPLSALLTRTVGRPFDGGCDASDAASATRGSSEERHRVFEPELLPGANGLRR